MNRPDINVTPLIDVLLVLLIIFMLVTPTKFGKMEARIPSEPTQQNDVDVHPETLIVEIDRDRTLTLNSESTGSTVDLTQKLENRLGSIFAQRTANGAFVVSPTEHGSKIERTVFIKAPKDISYGDVSKVVDAVRVAGASPVSLQIDNLK